MSTYLFRYLLMVLLIGSSQWFVSSYALLLSIWFLTGALSAWIQPKGRNFFPAFWIEAILAGIFFVGLGAAGNGAHVRIIFDGLGYGSWVFTTLLIVFNALTAAFCVALGSVLVKVSSGLLRKA